LLQTRHFRYLGQDAGRDYDLAKDVIRLSIYGRLLLILWLSPPVAAQQGPPSAIPVGTVAAERRPIEESPEFVWRVEAINRVEIRARVTGYLEEVLFKKGDLIKARFIASRREAQDALERNKAKNVGSTQTRDEAAATDGEAKGAIMQDEANLSTA
jgi:membrane fusion protein (multidrug efflux system)